jgi:hypothetical protein
MRLIGNTAADVARFLERSQPRPVLSAYIDHLHMPADERLVSPLERSLFGEHCGQCGAVNELCIAPTGLPSSYPHPERIRGIVQ